MQDPTGAVELTVLADTGTGADVPRTATFAIADILSVHDVEAGARATTPNCGARVVLVETVSSRTAWVFSDEDDDAPSPHRELLVEESRRVADLIVGWARLEPQTFAAADVKAWDEWLAAGMPLDHDVVAPPTATFRKREIHARPKTD